MYAAISLFQLCINKCTLFILFRVFSHFVSGIRFQDACLPNLLFLDIILFVLCYVNNGDVIPDADYDVASGTSKIIIHKLEELPLLICQLNKKVFFCMTCLS